MYRAYYAAAGSGGLSPLEAERWPFQKEFSSLDEALLWAQRVAAKGVAVLAIDGDDGTHLTRNEIAPSLLPTLWHWEGEMRSSSQSAAREMETTAGVTISDLLTPDRVLPRIHAGHKREVLRLLAAHVSRATGLETQVLTEAVLSCAEFPAFGPSTGVALPHAFVPELKEPVAIFARLEPALDFGAADGSATDLVVLLMSPAADPAAHLRALACLARRLRNREVRNAVRAAASPDAIYALLTAGE